MKFSKKNTAIFLVNKNTGTFYSKSLSKSSNINFPEDVISHLEIVDNQKLEELINSFLDKNKIEGSPLYLLLGADTTFEKDLSDTLPADFLDIVPFEETQSKVFKIQKKEKIIAANKGLSEHLSKIFGNKGFGVQAIIPSSIIREVLPKIKADDLPEILKKIDSVKKYSLLSKSVTESPKNTKLIVLVIIFAGLILALATLIYFQYFAARPINTTSI